MKTDLKRMSPCGICKNRVLCLASEYPVKANHNGEYHSNRELQMFIEGDYIFKKGETASTIFCIYTGEVEVFNTNERNEKVVTKVVTDGDIIGYNSIANGLYVNSARATDFTCCCVIKLFEIPELAKSHDLIFPQISEFPL